jgi:cytochrome c oxidase subunit II
MLKRIVEHWLLSAGVLSLGACSGQQSALDPAGPEAEQIARLFWLMTVGALAIWAAVVALCFWAMRASVQAHEARRVRMLIIGGGAVVPTVVLAGLLVYGLGIMPPLLARAPEGSLRIAVTGEQWWWRVRYLSASGSDVVLANEIRLPVGGPVEFELDSSDVIHSFWIPALGGKMDMIPGRRTRLTLHPTRTGTFRGTCAEYCGASHALMAFSVVVMEKAAFEQWLAQQSQPAIEPAEPLAARGRNLFLASGCSACHTIRGIGADGVIGPELTHVGSRASLGAGILANEVESFQRWIATTETIKPGVLMPHFGMLPPEELRAIAAYLKSLQ